MSGKPSEPDPSETGTTTVVLARSAGCSLSRVTDRQGSTLRVAADGDLPTEAVLGRLEHELSLAPRLDPSWAVVPMRLVSDGRELVLADPGGLTLDERLGTPMSLKPCLLLAVALARAVNGMHQAGIAHLDLSPPNILVDDANSVHLTGFGSSMIDAGGRPPIREQGDLTGSSAYMAPECTGRINRPVDTRSDLYSLGIILYQMLVGEVPFEAKDLAEWVYAHIAREPVPVRERNSSTPQVLSDMVGKLLSKNADERYQTASGVERDLVRCLESLSDDGRIDGFELGLDDVSPRGTALRALFGRDEELATLAACIERIRREASTELAVIEGRPGIGKSALVAELSRQASDTRTIWLSAKFDQQRRDVPLSTIGSAFGALARQVLREGEDEIARWKKAIADGLGRNTGVLVDLIPELEWIVGPQDPVVELGPTEARNRFFSVFGQFVAVSATPDRPMVLFLDDVQWVDPASLMLLEHLVKQDIGSLLVIVAYRDTEVDESHPLSRTIARLRRGGPPVSVITLDALVTADLQELLEALVPADEVSLRPLTQLLHRKTDGNPLFAVQFVRSALDDGLVAYDVEEHRWTIDLDGLAAQESTDDVVELMLAKLRRLPEATLEMLKRFSCVGHQCSLSVLSLISGRPEDEVAAAMDEAVRLGLARLSSETYRFEHDRIQEATYSLIAPASLPDWHLEIARVLLASSTPSEREERLFEITDHFNRGRDEIVDTTELRTLDDLNFAAGKKAKRTTAYSAARSYFERSLALLPEDAWEGGYARALELHLELVACEFVTGDPERASELFQTALEHADSVLDRAEVLRTWMHLHQGVGRIEEALRFGFEALRLFEISFPSAGQDILEAFMAEKAIFDAKLDGRAIEELFDLPVATDPTARAVMGLLADVGACAYNAMPALAPLIYCKGLNEALSHGNTESSCMTYISFGAFLVSRGDVRGATAFGELGMRLNERFDDPQWRGTLLYVQGTHVNVWTQHIADSLPLHEEGLRACQDVGDLVFANFNASSLLSISVEMGRDLGEVLRVAQRYAAFARSGRNEAIYQWMRTGEALANNLMGSSLDVERLDGNGFEEKVSLSAMAKGKFYTGLANLHLNRLMACVFHRRFEAAFAAAESCSEALNALRSGPLEVTYYFFRGLALAALCPEEDGERRTEVIEELTTIVDKLGFWAKHSPASYENRFALISAELARLESRDDEAMRQFDRAVESARDNGFTQNVALAAEAAASYYRGRGFERIERTYLQDAHLAYRRWGATAVVERLESANPWLERQTTAVKGDPAHVDLMAVIRAAQTVSNEMVLESLVEKLVKISIQDAGADRSLLVLVGQRDPRIVAEATEARDGLVVRLGDDEIDAASMPKSVFDYVVRTHEVVIVDDAAVANPFSSDTYFSESAPRSVLCFPLLKQGSLVGVGYLENHLAPGVFTVDRIRVFEILASQAAISIENALLYGELRREQEAIKELNASLEERVAARTSDLDRAIRRQQSMLDRLAEQARDLEEARDRADDASRSKSEFLANVSHEIRTPINAITGFTTLALRSENDPTLERYLSRIQTSAHGLLRIIDDLLDLSKIEAGHMEMEDVAFLLEEVMDHVIAQLEPRASDKGLELVTRLKPEVPESLVGDPYRLGQVLLNLCGNAIKFTEKGRVELAVGVESQSGETVRLAFQVRDTGIGLSEEQIDALFHAFTQADASITRRFGGTGLGLTISERIVNQLNGKIAVESTPGRGSTFSFAADYRVPMSDERPQSLRPAPSTARAKRLSGARLLLVEDNEINQEIATELLEQEGAIVTAAKDGRTALELLQGASPSAFDAVLLDLQMPDMDGFETARRIRLIPEFEELPLIALTAHAMRDERERCLAVGMNDHLAKPIDPVLMTDRVSHWIQQRRSGGEALALGPIEVPSSSSEEIELPGIDLRQGLLVSAGDMRRYDEYLERFAIDFREIGDELAGLLAAGERESARRRAHDLKGVAANLGLVDVARSAGVVFDRLAQGDVEADDLVTLGTRLRTVLEGIDAHLSSGREGDHTPRQSDDSRALDELLAELGECLELGDMKADTLMREVETRFADDGEEAPWVAEVAALVRRLDYEGALGALREGGRVSSDDADVAGRS